MNDRQKNTEMDLFLALNSLGYLREDKEEGVMLYKVTWSGEYLWYDYQSRILSLRWEDGEEIIDVINTNTDCRLYEDIKAEIRECYEGY